MRRSGEDFLLVPLHVSKKDPKGCASFAQKMSSLVGPSHRSCCVGFSRTILLFLIMATSDKYDRQLRLWGANGQRKLMTSHILLINSPAVGTETLKNLVLPGLGSFTILDDALLQPSDLGNNFFTPHPENEQTMETQQDNGGMKPCRGKVAVENLCEMNPDVKGYFMNSNLQTELVNGNSLFLTHSLNFYFLDPNFLQKFSLVIVANPTPSIAQLASAACWDSSVPLIIVRSYGFIGTFRLQIRGIHGIIESKPEAEQLDLRINSPFKELEVIRELEFS
jgi:NEDD8-activating enzyme E1 regulatory subunit